MLSSSRTLGPFCLRKPKHGKYSTPIIKMVSPDRDNKPGVAWLKEKEKTNKKKTADNADSWSDDQIFLLKKLFEIKTLSNASERLITAMLAPYKFPCSTIVVITEVKTCFSSLHSRYASQNTPHNIKTIITGVPQIFILQDWMGVQAAWEWWKFYYGKMHRRTFLITEYTSDHMPMARNVD